jgi:hypothetical protein
MTNLTFVHIFRTEYREVFQCQLFCAKVLNFVQSRTEEARPAMVAAKAADRAGDLTAGALPGGGL